MFRLVVFVGFMCGSSFCIAETELYWVLGSYSVRTNAEAQQVRLSELLSAEVVVTQHKDLAVFRVMVRAGEVTRDILVSHGIDSWLLPVDVPDAETVEQRIVPEPVVMEAAAEDSLEESWDDPIVIEEPGPRYPEILPHEYIGDYCERVPESRICRHGAIDFFIERQGVISKGKAELQETCRTTQDADVREICRGLF